MNYQEITLIEQADIGLSHIWSEVFQVIHGVFCHQENGKKVNIGVAFPQYSFDPKTNIGDLGTKIRLFAQTNNELASLDLPATLKGFMDYIHISSIKEVGDLPTHYEVYKRYRQKSAKQKAIRLETHYINKYGQEAFDDAFGSFDAVLKHCIKTTNNKNVPYIGLISRSTDIPYRLRLEKKIMQEPTEKFYFDGFGLSCKDNISAVPAW